MTIKTVIELDLEQSNLITEYVKTYRERYNEKLTKGDFLATLVKANMKPIKMRIEDMKKEIQNFGKERKESSFILDNDYF